MRPWDTNGPRRGETPPDEAMLLDRLLDRAPGEADRRRILVDSPTLLYGFT